jgi:hypothetical protein
MLDPDVVLNSVLASLQSIPELVAELGGPAIPATDSITGHYFFSGQENALSRALAQMRSPSLMVAYLDYVGGNFNAMTVFKHRLNMFIRPRNKAALNGGGAASAQHLWWMAMNLPVSAPIVAANIRYVNLANGNLDLMDLPTLQHRPDESNQDFFVSTLVFPEIGDAGPDGVDFLCIGPESVSQISATVEGFADAIRQHLTDEEQRQLLEEIQEGVGNGVTHSK